MTILKLKEAVRKLSPHERILFIQYILDTIAEDTATGEEGFHLSDEWKKELESRKEAFDTGHLDSKPWEDVKKRLLGE